jgi:Holliday junction resolvasome RuvABC endonuclease subunit
MTSKRIARLCQPSPDSPHRICGIDPSLNSTGYAYRHSGELYTGRVDPGKLTGLPRLFYVRNQIEKVLDAALPTIVVYEDYAMGAKGNNAFHMGELGGLLKLMTWERGIDLMLVSPTGLKKAIVGKGTADRGQKGKPEMRAALHEKFGYLLEQNDEADAFGLMLLGEIRFGCGGLPVGIRKQLRIDTLAECPVIKGKQQGLKLIAK